MTNVTLKACGYLFVVLVLIVASASCFGDRKLIKRTRRTGLMDVADAISTRESEVTVKRHVEKRGADSDFDDYVTATIDIEGESVTKRFTKRSDHNDIQLFSNGNSGIVRHGGRVVNKREWATYLSDDNMAAMLMKRDDQNRIVLEGSVQHGGHLYLVQPSPDSSRHVVHKLTTKRDASTSTQTTRPKTVDQVEMNMVFDNALYKRFAAVTPDGEDTLEIMREYYGLIINEVNVRFRSLAIYNVYIDVLMGRLMIDTDGTMNPFDSTLLDQAGKVNITLMCRSFRTWVKKNYLLDGDAWQMHTGCNPKPYYRKGWSWIYTACTQSRQSVVVNDMDFYAAFFAAHELGHTMGMFHDNYTLCGSYVMAPWGFKPTDPKLNNPNNAWRFSSCSADNAAWFIQYRKDLEKYNGVENCLTRRTENVGDLVNYLNTSWGNVLTLDEQCNRLRPNSRFCAALQNKYPPERICLGIPCRDLNYRCPTFSSFVGTPCGHNKTCEYGRCVKSEIGRPMSDTCPFGEESRGFIKHNGQRLTCAEKFENDPGFCAIGEWRKICCETCNSVSQ